MNEATVERPQAVSGRDFVAYIVRGPKSKKEETNWYWRIRRRGHDRKTVWMGWCTRQEVIDRVIELDPREKKVPAEEAEQEPTQTQGPTQTSNPENRMLKVAIVSDMDHAKSLTQALRAEGHMGFNFPDAISSIPPTMDVIVCRWRSTSHRSYNVCNEEKRKGRLVVFENGVTRAVEAVRAIANGTWEEPSLASNSEEDASARTWVNDPTSVEDEQTDRQRREQSCLESIEEIIDKGGLFFPELARRSPSQARDALQCVTYDKKDRVKRTAVFEAFNELERFRDSTIEAQFDALREEKKYPEGAIWWVANESGTGTEPFLARESLSPAQLQELAGGLTHPGRTYVHEEPLVLMQMRTNPPVVKILVEPPVVEIEVPIPVVEEAPSPEVTEIPTPQLFRINTFGVPAPILDPKAEKELIEYLEIVSAHLDQMKLGAIPSALLLRTGLCIENGLIALSIVHLAGPEGTCCGGPGTKTSLVPAVVTCGACQRHEFFKFATWYTKSLAN